MYPNTLFNNKESIIFEVDADVQGTISEIEIWSSTGLTTTKIEAQMIAPYKYECKIDLSILAPGIYIVYPLDNKGQLFGRCQKLVVLQ